MNMQRAESSCSGASTDNGGTGESSSIPVTAFILQTAASKKKKERSRASVARRKVTANCKNGRGAS